jgi:hypothetical protein
MKTLLMMKIFMVIFILAFASIASATPYTMTVTELLGMTLAWDNGGLGDLNPGYPQLYGGGAYFNGDIYDGNPQFRSIGIGYAWGTVPVSAQDLSGYDSYALNFYNDNQQNWFVNLYLNTGWTDAPWNETDTYAQNGWVELAPDASTSILLDFSNADLWQGGANIGMGAVPNLNHVTNIGFQIAFNESKPAPGGYQGDDYHLVVNPIPEPSTILLLGLGLLSLGAYGWHRKKKS